MVGKPEVIQETGFDEVGRIGIDKSASRQDSATHPCLVPYAFTDTYLELRITLKMPVMHPLGPSEVWSGASNLRETDG
jgi:hypothetical protein